MRADEGYEEASAGLPPDGVTILHLSDTDFGADGSPADHLVPSLDRLGDQLPRPDLVVLSGDITANGKAAEFRRARAFLDQLLELFGLALDHVVVVPGNHDVNRGLCQAYFIEQEEAEQAPVQPFAKKWAPYEQFVGDLHGDLAFAPDQPYTLHRFPQLGVVVAALNSTMEETHETHVGSCGQDQLRWFADRFSSAHFRDFVRIGVVHHNVRGHAELAEENLRDEQDLTRILGPQLDLVLHGHGQAESEDQSDRHTHRTLVLATGRADGDRCQLLRIERERTTRWVLRYRPDSRHWEAEADPSQPTSLPRLDLGRRASVLPRLLESLHRDVAAVTLLQEGVKDVSVRRHALDYLMVAGDTGEIWAVGVVDGPLTDHELERFCAEVHGPMSSRQPWTRSQLVHTGLPNDELRRQAARRGVVVKTWSEYQNLLDLSDYRKELGRRLEADKLYPQKLYLEQRYRSIGREGRGLGPPVGELADTVVDDILGPGPRFVLVLGDPGFGKSFLMRRVTHLLLTGTSGVTPIVVLLREAEKHHNLEAIVAPTLTDASASTMFQSTRFRHMFNNGRIVMLIDGYDEFAVRVGFARAADQLRTFLRAIEGEAKIVLTTRPNHFRSRDDITSQVFEDVLALDTNQRRIYELEAFTRDQQREFLARWFTLGGLVASQAEEAADAWMAALAGVDNLPELAQTPRMLSFMAQQLTLDQIQQVGTDDGPISAAGLYELLVDTWLATETDKFGPGTARRNDHRLTSRQRWKVAEDLAYRLWATNDTFVTGTLLEEVAASALDLPALGMTVPEAAQEIGSRTLLVGDGDRRYFAHQSIGEFLLARRLAALLRASDEPAELGHAELSELTARFLRDLVPDEGTRWLRASAQATRRDGDQGR